MTFDVAAVLLCLKTHISPFRNDAKLVQVFLWRQCTGMQGPVSLTLDANDVKHWAPDVKYCRAHNANRNLMLEVTMDACSAFSYGK